MQSALPTHDHELLALAKSKGTRKPRKDTKGGGEVDISLYVYQHEDGVLFAYENSTSDKELDEEVTFELKCLRIEDHPSVSKLEFVLGPNKIKIIKLTKTDPAFAISYNVSYLIRAASVTTEKANVGATLGIGAGIGSNLGVSVGVDAKGDVKVVDPKEQELKTKAKSQGSSKQRKETKTNNDVEIFQYVLQHDDGVFILYENRTKDFVLDEELTFDMKGLSLAENPGKTTVKIALQPGCDRTIHLVKTGEGFSIKYGMAYSVKFAGKGSFGAKRLPEEELIELAKSKGQKKDRKDSKTGNVVDIVLYVLQHDQGVFMYYENNTKDVEIEEDIKFELKNLKLAENPDGSTAKVHLKPGQKKGIILDSVAEDFSISYNVSYLIKQI